MNKIIISFLILSLTVSFVSAKSFEITTLAPWSQLVSDLRSPYDSTYHQGDEDTVRRLSSQLDDAYGIFNDLDISRDKSKVSMILVGVGRGFSAVELALRYPNLRIQAINREAMLWNKQIIQEEFILDRKIQPEQLEEALRRISVKVINLNAPVEAAFNSLGRADLVVFETSVMMYIRDKVKSIETFFNHHLKVGGKMSFELQYIKKLDNEEDLHYAGNEIIQALRPSGRVRRQKPIPRQPEDWYYMKFEKEGDIAVRIPLKLNEGLTDLSIPKGVGDDLGYPYLSKYDEDPDPMTPLIYALEIFQGIKKRLSAA